MKISLAQVRTSLPALEALSQQRTKNVKLAYRLSRIHSDVKSENQLLEESRVKLLKEYGIDPTAPIEEWSLTPQIDQELGTKWTELLGVQVEVWGDAIALEDIEGLEVSAADIELLDWLIKEPAELKLVDKVTA